MNEIKTILGPPGCGKTQTNSNLILGYIKEGVIPSKIACVSFTRKAATESRERVCKDGGLTEEDLPYFQTLHSMAFHALGYKRNQVMGPSDFRKIGEETGLEFSKKRSNAENDFDFVGHKTGDLYLNMYVLSRNTLKPLNIIFNEAQNHALSYTELTRFVGAYESYKKAEKKVDFVDMIEQFIAQKPFLGIDVLVVDEAQDLSTLQWKMINEVLRREASTQIFTGDDDQAIMLFQGADVKAFLNATEKKEVLSQSYRVPRAVHEKAQSIAEQIEGRASKNWEPTSKEGSITYHYNFADVPIDKGEWTILARTKKTLNKHAAQLKNEGWIYRRDGKPSIPVRSIDAIDSWTSLCKGEEITMQQARNIYSYMKAGEGFKKGYGPRSPTNLKLAGEFLVNMDYLHKELGLLVDDKKLWYQVLGKIGEATQNYILNALKRGDRVKNPRIKLSTIHSMKGGEDDNILIIPELSFAADKEYKRNPSTEHRVFYVAVTRAKKHLHIMQPNPQERNYDI